MAERRFDSTETLVRFQEDLKIERAGVAERRGIGLMTRHRQVRLLPPAPALRRTGGRSRPRARFFGRGAVNPPKGATYHDESKAVNRVSGLLVATRAAETPLRLRSEQLPIVAERFKRPAEARETTVRVRPLGC
jgi:hypothetical protein